MIEMEFKENSMLGSIYSNTQLVAGSTSIIQNSLSSQQATRTFELNNQLKSVNNIPLLDNQVIQPNSTQATAKLLTPTVHSQSRVPKEINYIWMGGAIKEKDLRAILQTTKLNTGYKVTIWTDRPMSIHSTLEKMLDNTMDSVERYLAFTQHKNLNICAIDDIFNVIDANQLVHPKHGKDKPRAALSLLVSYFQREKNGLYRNYAAASDIARLVLALRGGIYFDVDIMPSISFSDAQIEWKRKCEDLFERAENHIVRYENSNAVLITTPHHPLTYKLLNQIISGYFHLNTNDSWINKRSKLPKNYQHVIGHSVNRLHTTMDLTGPELLGNLLSEEDAEPQYLRYEMAKGLSSIVGRFTVRSFTKSQRLKQLLNEKQSVQQLLGRNQASRPDASATWLQSIPLRGDGTLSTTV